MKPKAYPGRVIFDHLPKTAVQAVNNWLISELGFGCVTPNLIGNHHELIRRYGGEFSVISGHIHFEGKGFDSRYSYATCLREPIDRAVSWLYFLTKNHDADQFDHPELWAYGDAYIASEGDEMAVDLCGFLNNPYVEHFAAINGHVAMSDDEKLQSALSVIYEYEVLGVFENLPQFISDFSGLLGLPKVEEIAYVNTTISRPAVQSISARLRKNLENLNALDIEFYRQVRNFVTQNTRQHTVLPLVEVSPWLRYEPSRRREYSVAEFTILSAVIKGGDSVQPGQTMCFELTFSSAADFPEVVMGIHILDEFGRKAFGANSDILDGSVFRIELGTHVAHLYLVADLPAGQFTAGFAFVEKSAREARELAWFDKLATFTVKEPTTKSSIGYLDLVCNFDCRKLSNTVQGLVVSALGTMTCEVVLGAVSLRELFYLPVMLTNLSKQIWMSTESNLINLSYHWLDMEGNVVVFEGERTQLPVSEVLLGQEVAVQLRVLAPARSGQYQLRLMPVQEGLCWFDEKGFTPGLIKVDVVESNAIRYYPGADVRLFSQTGIREGRALVSSGKEGFLMFGPYAQMAAGKYVVRVEGQCELTAKGMWCDVAHDKGSQVLARHEIEQMHATGVIVELAFTIDEPVSDLEVRFWCPAEVQVRIEALCIEPNNSAEQDLSAGLKEPVVSALPQADAASVIVPSKVGQPSKKKRVSKKR